MQVVSILGRECSLEKIVGKTVNSCPGLESEEAFIIDGNTIRKKIIEDRDAFRGFRKWPPKRQ